MSLNLGYVTFSEEFPITNHLNADDGNLGWVRGAFDDGMPFEAEMWIYGGHKSVTILVPAAYHVRCKKEDDEDKGIIQFQMSGEFENGGALSVGMVNLGNETDDEVIHNWVYYLEEKEFINFVGEWRNGAVRYVVDINGNVFSEIIVEIEDEDRVYATTEVKWNKFPLREKKRKFTIVH